ncbi:MAG: DMT family transporter [Alphaproteobacteria bacterium]
MSPAPRSHVFAAYAALALSMMLVGSNVPLAKYLTAHLPPAWVGLMRCGASVVALAPLRLARPNAFAWPSLQRFVGLAGLGLCGVFFYPVFLLLGLKTTGALAAGAITATLPAIVAVLSIFVLRERAGPRLIAGVAVAVMALLLLNISSVSGSSGSDLRGNVFVLLAVIGEAGYVILARCLAADGATPIGMALGANVAGLIAFAMLALAGGGLSPPTAPAAAWWGSAWFGITSSVIALILWFWGIARVKAARAGIFSVFLPLTAGAIAILLLGERANLLTLAGLVAVLIAIALTAEPEEPLPLS